MDGLHGCSLARLFRQNNIFEHIAARWKGGPRIPCVVFSHRFHRFHRCCALEWHRSLVWFWRAGCYGGRPLHQSLVCAIIAQSSRSICEICAICEKIPRVESAGERHVWNRCAPFHRAAICPHLLFCLKESRAVSHDIARAKRDIIKTRY